MRRNAVVSDDGVGRTRRTGQDRIRTDEGGPHAVHVDVEVADRRRYVSSVEVLLKNFGLDVSWIYRCHQPRSKAVCFISNLDGAGRPGRCRVAGTVQSSVEEARN